MEKYTDRFKSFRFELPCPPRVIEELGQEHDQNTLGFYEEDVIEAVEKKLVVNQMVDELPLLEREIVARYYGLAEHFMARDHAAIAEELGLHEQEVVIIRQTAENRLRARQAIHKTFGAYGSAQGFAYQE